VIVRNVDKLDAGALERLAEYAHDPAPYTCLVLVAAKIAKNSKLYRAVAKVGITYEYAAPKRSEYAAEVVKLLRERGKAIALTAAQVLVDIVGRDLRRLDIEADKLASFMKDADRVTVEEVRAVAAASAEASVFELCDAVGERDVTKALRVLRRLLDAGETPLGIQAMLGRHVRALIGTRALAARGVAPEAMSPEIGMAPWQARNVARQSGAYTPAELVTSLKGLAASEEEMKTSPTDAGLVIERWIVRTTGAVRTR
jgi:DNA polymerase-3 subunit delta